MKIDIKGTKLELTPSIKKYVEEKLGKIGRYLGRFAKKSDAALFVEVGRSTKHHKQGDVYYAEATMPVEGETIRVEQHSSDLRKAIDAVKDRLKISLRKFKEEKTGKRAEKLR